MQTNELVTDWGVPLAKDFRRGQWVFYVPAHAAGDPDHPDIEYGVVSSANKNRVFVRFLDAAATARMRPQCSAFLRILLIPSLMRPNPKAGDAILKERHILILQCLPSFHYDLSGVTAKGCNPSDLQKIWGLDEIKVDL